MPFGKVMLYLVAIFLPPYILLPASASFSRIFPKIFFDPEEWNGKRKSEPAFFLPPYILLPGSRYFSRILLKTFLCRRAVDGSSAWRRERNNDCAISPSIHFTSSLKTLFAHFFESIFLISRILKKALHMTGNDDISLSSPSHYFTSGIGTLFTAF